MNEENAKRKHFYIPSALLERIEKYQKTAGHTTFTSALLELVRIGLKEVEETN